jgi:hypothetical protein
MKRTLFGLVITCAAMGATAAACGSSSSGGGSPPAADSGITSTDSGTGTDSPVSSGDSSSPGNDSSTPSTDSGTPGSETSTSTGDGDGGNTIVGTINGQSFSVGASVGNTFSDMGASVAVVALISPTVSNLCATLGTNTSFANAQILEFIVASISTITTGQAYQLMAPPDGGSVGLGAQAEYGSTNATCDSNGMDMYATGGDITFTTLSASVMAGTFALSFPNGDTANGSFNVPVCAALGNEKSDGGAVDCMQ